MVGQMTERFCKVSTLIISLFPQRRACVLVGHLDNIFYHKNWKKNEKRTIYSLKIQTHVVLTACAYEGSWALRRWPEKAESLIYKHTYIHAKTKEKSHTHMHKCVI